MLARASSILLLGYNITVLKYLGCLLSNDPNRLVELTLIACYLFIVFEFLYGNHEAALIHSRSGLNILRRGNDSLNITSRLRQELFDLFSVLDTRSRMWCDTSPTQLPIARHIEEPDRCSTKTAREFSSLGEAARSLNLLIAQVYDYQQLTRRYDFPGILGQTPWTLSIKRRSLIDFLEIWSIAVDTFLFNADSAISVDTSHRIAVVKINKITLLIILTASIPRQATTSDSSAALYRTFEPKFRELVSLAASVIFLNTGLVLKGGNTVADCNPRDSFITSSFSGSGVLVHTSLIYPLYFTTVKSQSPEVCRQALALLSVMPWH